MNIITSIEAPLKSLLLKKSLLLRRTTDPDLLDRFFSSVSPISTNHKLIRIGREGDGGYLIPNDLEGIEVCFSPGVEGTADFERDLANRGIKCFFADY